MASRPACYKLSPRAVVDLEEIWHYTSKTWSSKQAEAYHSQIVSVFEALAAGHKIGRPVDVRAGYLKYVVGSHFVYYRQQEAEIIVVRILHQRMDTNRHLGLRDR